MLFAFLCHFDSAIHTLHLHAPTQFEVIRDKTHINKGLNQLTETTGSNTCLIAHKDTLQVANKPQLYRV